MSETTLETYAANIYQEVAESVQIDGVEALEIEVFTNHMVGQVLSEVGEIEEALIGYAERRHGRQSLRCHGVGWCAETGRVDLIATEYKHQPDLWTLPRKIAESACQRAALFLERAIGGLHADMEQALPGYEMARLVHDLSDEINEVRIVLVSNGVLRDRVLPSLHAGGHDIDCQVWDLERFHRLESSGIVRESIDIDLDASDHGGIPCLPLPEDEQGIKTWMAVIPGITLASMYRAYGARLLESNVRSFLQLRGNVNKGIRQTALNEPKRFLAYNNGITATATGVVVETREGIPQIVRLKDLQIVNGGQTTATLHAILTKDRANEQLYDIRVPMKLTQLNSQTIAEEIVPLISRYANSQNKISEADLTANHPFHIRIEELSRTIWAPATTNSNGLQTHWFYERARGQYNVELARARTPKQKADFKRNNPTRQKIIKTDIAKFEMTWRIRPDLVSRGAQKCFLHFMEDLSKRKGFMPDERYFRHLCAKGILFRATERVVSAQDFGGYRAQIVTYTLALIAHRLQQRIGLESIWKEQNISREMEDAISRTSHLVHGSICNPPGGRNVTEWCKRPECWKSVQSLKPDLTELEAIAAKQFPNGAPSYAGSADQASDLDKPTKEEEEIIRQVSERKEDYWFGVAKWAKETNNLAGWQRSLAFNIGRRIARGQAPSIKMAKQGLIIMEEADRVGFQV